MIAIIDGDVLCYQACESRWKLRCETGPNIIKYDEHMRRIPLEFSKEEDSKYLSQSYDKLKKDLDKLLENVWCSEYLMAVKGDGNFRNQLYPEYKLNRHADPNKQNLFVPVLRKLAAKEDLAIEAHGMEADDLMRIWAEECKMSGKEYVVCTIDKDLDCIPGRHYRMHIGRDDNERLVNISEEEAMRHYYEQLLKGDPTDNIPGVPRVGEVKASKLLAPYTQEIDFQEIVVEQYFGAYGPEAWLNMLLSNGKMIHLLRHMDDYFNCLDWPIVQELT